MIKISTLIHLELEGLPPTVNHMYRTSGRYRYKTAEAREYQNKISEQMNSLWGKSETYNQPVSLEIIFETSGSRRWDIDNRVKALQDCLSMAGIIKDDMQINRLHVERHNRRITRTLIKLETFEEAEDDIYREMSL